MVENNPYDVMGCWVTQDTWLAGNMSTVSILIIIMII